jgi:glycerol-3-phosphate O-acyltransferase
MSDRRVVLEFASTATEREVLEEWRRKQSRDDEVRVVDSRDLALATIFDDAADTRVTPVRVVWLPRERAGARAAGVRDLLALRNPRRPREGTQRRILRSEPDRCRVIVGEPATIGEMRARFQNGGDDAGLTPFVVRQGALALERAERELIGTQYKVPRFVSEDLRSSARFRTAAAELADRLGRPPDEVAQEAGAAIEEMVASQSRVAIDVWSDFGRWLSRAYTVDVDESGFARLREINRSHPLVFLPSHRSYLDPLVLRTALHQQDFPPNHVLGGMNVGFWPIGPVARRSGYVFIRRSFKDDEVYKLALREYMAYLMRKRFNLEWYIEGGRSRTGKLRPPRYGLLAYLVEAFQAGGVDDVQLVPVSIVYDQLYEVGAMAAEERGAQKAAEGVRWLVGYARAQGRRLGHVYVRVGEAMSLREALAEESAAGPRRRNEVEKVAFEVSYRIGRATPITATSLVTLALLGVEDRALTISEIRSILEPLLDYVDHRRLPMTGEVRLRTMEVLEHTLDLLCSSGPVRRFTEGAEPVWGIAPDRHLEAAFYRNAAVHFFVNRAITELLLARAAEGHAADVLWDAWEEALRLRDLLKFDFFFARKREYSEEIRSEMAFFDPRWEERRTDPQSAEAMLAGARFHLAHRVLRPFLEAYLVVADCLAGRDPEEELDKVAFVRRCIGLGRQYQLQRRLNSPESISKERFDSALRLAANRDLVAPGGEELSERRRAFADEIRTEVRRVDFVRDLALRALERAPR